MRCRCWKTKRLDIKATWVVLRPQSLSWCKSSTFPALAWEECAASGTSQEFLLDCTLSGPSSLPHPPARIGVGVGEPLLLLSL